MSIIVQQTTTAPTYDWLLTQVASYLKRSDLTSQIPTFIMLAESKFARDLRIRPMLTGVTMQTIPGSRNISLPGDWLEFDSVVLNSQPSRVLTYVTNETIDNNFPENGATSKPEVYTIVGTTMEFGPVPDSNYDVRMTYYAKFPGLEANGTNWLLSNHPGIYLYAVLMEASLFGFADDRLVIWSQRLQADLESLKVADERSNWSGSALRVRVAV